MLTPQQKTLIASWMQAWAADDETAAERVNDFLKATGVWAFQAASGYPTVNHWYNGPIEPGMQFHWRPELSNEWCKVTRVVPVDGDEPRVFTVTKDGKEAWNDESHFRASVVEAGRKA